MGDFVKGVTYVARTLEPEPRKRVFAGYVSHTLLRWIPNELS